MAIRAPDGAKNPKEQQRFRDNPPGLKIRPNRPGQIGLKHFFQTSPDHIKDKTEQNMKIPFQVRKYLSKLDIYPTRRDQTRKEK